MRLRARVVATAERVPTDRPAGGRPVAQHEALFGRVPQVCAADKGYSSQQALEELAKFNLPELCVPKQGRRNEAEAEREHSAWFKMGQTFERVFQIGRRGPCCCSANASTPNP